MNWLALSHPSRLVESDCYLRFAQPHHCLKALLTAPILGFPFSSFWNPDFLVGFSCHETLNNRDNWFLQKFLTAKQFLNVQSTVIDLHHFEYAHVESAVTMDIWNENKIRTFKRLGHCWKIRTLSLTSIFPVLKKSVHTCK